MKASIKIILIILMFIALISSQSTNLMVTPNVLDVVKNKEINNAPVQPLTPNNSNTTNNHPSFSSDAGTQKIEKRTSEYSFGLKSLESNNQPNSIKTVYGVNDTLTYLNQTNNDINITVSPLSNQNYELMNNTLKIMAYRDPVNIIFSNDTTKTTSFQGITTAQLVSLDNITELSAAIVSSFQIRIGSLTPQAENISGEIWSAKLNSDGKIIPNQKIDSTLVLTSSTANTENITFVFSSPITITTTNTFYNASLKKAYIFFVFYSHTAGSQWVYYRTDTTDSTTDKGETYTKSDTSDWTEEWYDCWLNYNYGYLFDHDLIKTKINITSENKVVSVSNTNKVIDNNTKSSESYIVTYNSTLSWAGTKLNITVYRFSFNVTWGDSAYFAESNQDTIDWNITASFTVNLPLNSKQFISLPKSFNVLYVQKNGVNLTLGPDYVLTRDIWGNKSILILAGVGSYFVKAINSNLLWGNTIYTFTRENNTWVSIDTFKMGTLYPSKKQGDFVKANMSSTVSQTLKNGVLNATLFDPDGIILGNQSILPDYIDKWNNTQENGFNGTISFVTAIDPNQTAGIWTIQFYWRNGSSVGLISKNITVIPLYSTVISSPAKGENYLENDLIQVTVATLDKSHNSDWEGNNPGMISWEFENKSLSRDGMFNASYYKYTTTLNLSINAFSITPGRYNISVIFTDGLFNYTWNTYFYVYYRAKSNVNGVNEIYYYENFNLLVTPINVTGNGGILNSSSIVFDVVEAPFNAQYVPSTGKYNLTIFNNGFLPGYINITIKWKLNGYRHQANNEWVEYIYTILVKQRPVVINLSNDQLNGSTVIFQEEYFTKIVIRDGLNGSFLNIGSLIYTANTTSDQINILQFNENNGSYQETFKIVTPNRLTSVIQWTFSATGFKTTVITLVVRISPRPLQFLVVPPSEFNATGKSEPISVVFIDALNNSLIDVTRALNNNYLQILSSQASYNGSGSWEYGIHQNGLIIYFILTEADGGKNITLTLPLILFGYGNVSLIITVHVNPLIHTTVNYSGPSEVHYFEEKSITINYLVNGTPVQSYDVQVSAINAADNFTFSLTINPETSSRSITFSVTGYVPNNILKLMIRISKPGYESQIISLNITMLKAEVEFIYSNPADVRVSNGEVSIPITITAYGINVTTQLELIDWNTTLYPEINPKETSDHFILIIPLSNDDAGKTVYILIKAKSPILTGNTTIIFDVAKLEKISVDVEITGQLIPGDTFSIVLTASSTNQTLLIYLNQQNTGIDYTKLTANISLTYKLANGTVINIFDSEAFNSEGKSILGPFLIPENTVDMALSINVEGLGIQPISLNPKLTLQTPPTSSATNMLNPRILIYLAGIIATLLIVGLLIRKKVKKKEAVKRQKSLALQIIGEVSNTRALIIVDRRTGYSIFTYKFQDIAVDPQLIAGILHAYGAFDQEMTGDFAVDVPPGFYRVELGNHNISRIVGNIYDFYLITTGSADSLKDGLIKFAEWFNKEFYTEEPVVDLRFYDEREKEIIQKISEYLYAWITSPLIFNENTDIGKLKGLKRKIAEYVKEKQEVEFTEIIEEFSINNSVSDLFMATNKLITEGYLLIKSIDNTDTEEENQENTNREQIN